MKILVQRVKQAQVIIEDKVYNQISKGLLLYVCLEKDDTKDKVIKAVEKVSKLRVFEDQQEKMNLNIQEVQGEILSISQFTLSWDGRKGNRPSFENSMTPNQAKLLYSIFNQELSKKVSLKQGRFGAVMQVKSINDGPVTFHLCL